MSEILAPTLTLSAFCDTELGSVFQSLLPHLQNCQSRNSRSLSERIHSVANPPSFERFDGGASSRWPATPRLNRIGTRCGLLTQPAFWRVRVCLMLLRIMF